MHKEQHRQRWLSGLRRVHALPKHVEFYVTLLRPVFVAPYFFVRRTSLPHCTTGRLLECSASYTGQREAAGYGRGCAQQKVSTRRTAFGEEHGCLQEIFDLDRDATILPSL